MKPVIAVLDDDKRYADRLAQAANRSGRLPFEVIAFSSPEKLGAFSEKSPVEILLAGKGIETGGLAVKKLFTLSEQPGQGEIYKYQSGEDIIREVMNTYSAEARLPAGRGNGSCRCLAVYSPLGQCGKTSFALCLGIALAERERTLYLSLEEFSGLRALSGQECKRDISDLIYHREKGNLGEAALAAVVHSFGALDWVPPVRYPEDLPRNGEEALGGLVSDLIAMPGYRFLVVDMGESRHLPGGILNLADRIFMPVREDSVSVAKIREFTDYLKRVGREELLGRISKIRLPEDAPLPGEYPGNLFAGPMGSFAEALIREDPVFREARP